jgi:hypothetical protein
VVQVKLSFGLQNHGVGTPKHWRHRSMAMAMAMSTMAA